MRITGHPPSSCSSPTIIAQSHCPTSSCPLCRKTKKIGPRSLPNAPEPAGGPKKKPKEKVHTRPKPWRPVSKKRIGQRHFPNGRPQICPSIQLAPTPSAWDEFRKWQSWEVGHLAGGNAPFRFTNSIFLAIAASTKTGARESIGRYHHYAIGQDRDVHHGVREL